MSSWQQILTDSVNGNPRTDLHPPHIEFLSLPEISSWSDQSVVIEWDVPRDADQGSGFVFGGYISSLSDHAAGAAVLTVLKDDEFFLTKELNVKYLKPLKVGLITIIAEVKHITTGYIDVLVSFKDATSQLCATAEVQQAIIS